MLPFFVFLLSSPAASEHLKHTHDDGELSSSAFFLKMRPNWRAIRPAMLPMFVCNLSRASMAFMTFMLTGGGGGGVEAVGVHFVVALTDGVDDAATFIVSKNREVNLSKNLSLEVETFSS